MRNLVRGLVGAVGLLGLFLALAARIFSLIMTGLSQDLIPPMVVEVVLLTILVLGRRVLPRPQA